MWLETKETENKTDWTERTTEEIEQEREAETQEKDAAELGTLTDKVLYLMEKISEYGFLTMAEVQRVFTNKTYAYDVMKRLRGQGWIADFDTAMRPAAGHYLTPRGYLALVKFGKLRVGARFRVERYTPFIFRHRMACARAGLALEKHPLVRDFLPESLLRRRQNNETEKLCDGEFWYAVPGREEAERVGLEVELTLKNKEYLAESFEKLSRRELDQVWWLCGDETILRALRHQVIDREWRLRGQRHFFCLLDEFLAAKEQRPCLIDAGGQEFTIDPKAPTLVPRLPEPPPAPIAAEAQPDSDDEQPPVQPAPPPPPEAPPDPERTARPAHRRLAQVGSLAKKVLAWLWRWLRESWSVYERYDGGRTLYFHRWPHVLAAVGLGISILVYRVAPRLIGEVAAIVNPPPPAPVWKKRTVRDYGIENGGWVLSPRTLKSSGNRYRFVFGLGNQDSSAYGVCAASIQDARGRTLASRTWREVRVQRGYRLAKDQSFEFAGPRGMDRFFVVISDNQSGCGKTDQGIPFLVQFD